MLEPVAPGEDLPAGISGQVFDGAPPPVRVPSIPRSGESHFRRSAGMPSAGGGRRGPPIMACLAAPAASARIVRIKAHLNQVTALDRVVIGHGRRS